MLAVEAVVYLLVAELVALVVLAGVLLESQIVVLALLALLILVAVAVVLDKLIQAVLAVLELLFFPSQLQTFLIPMLMLP
jgi:hypothetical protein